jgi:ureidoglycolate dehydrogenase (NAD+)
MQYLFAPKLREIMYDQFISQDVHENSAYHVCEALIQTSLRGVDSHGINLFPHYCRVAATSRININPTFKILKQGPSSAVFDAVHAFGHHACAEATSLAIKHSKQTGTGAVAIKNSSHFAAAAYYALMAAENDCIGFAFTNADSLVKAHGSVTSYFGTNPMCMTAPMEGESPFCLDMATSAIAWNKVRNYRRTNTALAPNIVFDADGNTVTDPHQARSVAPTGGYKGFGLGMMVEILCSMLAGGPFARELVPMYQNLESKRNISHFVFVLDISAFTEVAHFKQMLANMAAQIRSLPAESPDTPVMIPGDPEKRAFAIRSQYGIPIDTSKFDEFLEISVKFKEALLCTTIY